MLAPWYRSFGGLRITANVKVVVSSRIYSQPGSAIDESTGHRHRFVPTLWSPEPTSPGGGPRKSLGNPWPFPMTLGPRDVTLIGVTC